MKSMKSTKLPRHKLWFSLMLLISFSLGMIVSLGLSWKWTGEAGLIVPLFGIFGVALLLIFVMVSFMGDLDEKLSKRDQDDYSKRAD